MPDTESSLQCFNHHFKYATDRIRHAASTPIPEETNKFEKNGREPKPNAVDHDLPSTPNIPKMKTTRNTTSPHIEEVNHVGLFSPRTVILFSTFLPNVQVHQIRPTQRTFTTSITSPSPVNKLPTSAVGFGWHDLFCFSQESSLKSDCNKMMNSVDL